MYQVPLTVVALGLAASGLQTPNPDDGPARLQIVEAALSAPLAQGITDLPVDGCTVTTVVGSGWEDSASDRFLARVDWSCARGGPRHGVPRVHLRDLDVSGPEDAIVRGKLFLPGDIERMVDWRLRQRTPGGTWSTVSLTTYPAMSASNFDTNVELAPAEAFEHALRSVASMLDGASLAVDLDAHPRPFFPGVEDWDGGVSRFVLPSVDRERRGELVRELGYQESSLEAAYSCGWRRGTLRGSLVERWLGEPQPVADCRAPHPTVIAVSQLVWDGRGEGSALLAVLAVGDSGLGLWRVRLDRNLRPVSTEEVLRLGRLHPDDDSG